MSNDDDDDDLAYYDPRHPERQAKDLVWAPDGKVPAGYKALRAEQGQPPVEQNWLEKTRILCWACGWTNRHQLHSSYSPRVKIFHSRCNMGMWDIAGRWVLRDQPNDMSTGNDLMTQKFLRAQPGHTIPLVSDMLELSGPNDPVQLTLMRQARGRRLNVVWPQLSAAQREGYVRQMATIIQQLRQFTAPCAQKVDGSLLDDFVIGYCISRRAPSCTKIGRTTEAWLDALEPSLRGGLSRLHKTTDPAIIEAKLHELRANFPSGAPYYLTHGDLNLSNIIVHNDKIEAILDWEMAGYYPWWAERYLSLFNKAPSNDLFEPVWALLEPERNHAKMQQEVCFGVGKVITVFGKCNVDHPGEHDCWLRPAFSACEASAGTVLWSDCGNQVEHKLRDVQWGDKNPNFPKGGVHAYSFST
jgi:hypothetical protein